MLAAAAWLAPAVALGADQSLAPLLERGPVVLVEDAAEGGFRQATAIIEVHAPPEVVWRTLLAMDRFKEFVPKITVSDVTHRTAASFDVHLVYDLPGPDTDYRARMVIDEAARELRGSWLEDDLRGSSWSWRVVANGPGTTLLFHTVRVKNFSPLLQQVEDDQQTVTVGVNVSSALSTVKALKRRSEERLARR